MTYFNPFGTVRTPMPARSGVRVALLAVAVFLASTTGCASYYAASYSTSGSIGMVPPDDMTPSSRDRLAAASSIAFVPPDICDQGDRIGYGNSGALIEISCGALMAELEQSATEAGWHVVSWLALPRHDVLGWARAEGVDVLAQVNDVRSTIVAGQSEDTTVVEFWRVDRDENRVGAWFVREDYAPVCAQHVIDELRVGDFETVGLDGQFIDVESARVLYHYHAVYPLGVASSVNDTVYWTSNASDEGAICTRATPQPNLPPRATGSSRSSMEDRARTPEVSVAYFGGSSETNIGTAEQIRRDRFHELVADFVGQLGEPTASGSYERPEARPDRDDDDDDEGSSRRSRRRR